MSTTPRGIPIWMFVGMSRRPLERIPPFPGPLVTWITNDHRRNDCHVGVIARNSVMINKMVQMTVPCMIVLRDTFIPRQRTNFVQPLSLLKGLRGRNVIIYNANTSSSCTLSPLTILQRVESETEEFESQYTIGFARVVEPFVC